MQDMNEFSESEKGGYVIVGGDLDYISYDMNLREYELEWD